jgi:L-ascorbate metabolism protein UlaG (beta-lactamase superfamily)
MDGLTLEWFGCTTFRLRTNGVTLLLDAYLHKVPEVRPQFAAADVPEADFVLVTHAHFDHMVDAAALALATGARIVGNYEVMRVLRLQGVPAEQLLPASGGETLDCGSGVSVRILPGLHSCLFAASDHDSAIGCVGDLGVSLAERREKVAALFGLLPSLDPGLAEYFARTEQSCSPDDGGQLNYLVTTPHGTVLLNASAGYWSSLIAGLRPDLALIALTGRPNVDGEPFQGSLADFLLAEVDLLQPRLVALCHHDPLLPPLTPAVDTTEALRRLAAEAPHVRYLELSPGRQEELDLR